MELFAPERIFMIGSFPVTNTFINTLFIDSVLIIAMFVLAKKIRLVPGFFQTALEFVIEEFYRLTESVSPKQAGIIFPFFMSFFIVILLTNWSGLLPGFGTIGFWQTHDHMQKLVPIFRSATTDLNTTFALALVSLVATHFLSIKLTGIRDYLARFFPLGPMIFIGLLEVVSEITKIVSLSFRLFGNIFAGEVVLGTISNILPFTAFVFPLPFLFLEIIVGAVQALVFSMLTMAFMAILTTPHYDQAKEVNH